MKKSLKLCSCLLGGILVLAGCNDYEANWPMKAPDSEDITIDTPWSDFKTSATSLSFASSEISLSLNKGETHEYSISVEPRDVDLSSLVWESDNESVATISDGLLTAVGGGEATIIARCGEVTARSMVNVTVPIVDFSVSNKSVDLDYGEEVQLVTTFDPSDTTQNKLTYQVISGESATISESGLIKASQTAGDTEIRVTNEVLNKVERVNVHVSDRWNYVDSISLSGIDRLEVSKVGQLAANVVAKDPTATPSTLANNKVSYQVKEGSESYASVNEETGEVTALEPGNATIVASILDERSGKTVKGEISFEIFEVKATAITLSEDGPIALNNKDALSHQLSYSYTVSEEGYTLPSRGNVTFSSDNLEVAKVSESGLIEVVGKGSATITVKDETYNVFDTIEVNITIFAKSVELNASGEFYLDEEITISASVTPAKTSEDVVFEYTSGTTHEFIEDGNSLKIKCSNLEEVVTVKAHVGSTESNEITLTPKEREVLFENGKTYVVGSSNYKTGVSKDVTEGSWNQAKYAYVMTDRTKNPNAEYEYKATIEFREGDEWKIRENVEDWRNIEGFAGEGDEKYATGRYKVDEGAFLNGSMSVNKDENVLVNKAGKYDIYYAFYTNEHPEGWYEVYVEEHGLKIKTTSIHAKLGDGDAKVEKLQAENYDGTLTLKEVDESIISVAIDATNGVISITPVAIGTTSFKVCDDYKEVEITVEIKEESTAEKTQYYLRGEKINNWVPSDEYALTVSTDPNNVGEILDVYLEGDFKIGDSNWGESWGYDYDGHNTIIGGAASNFSLGKDNNNICCNVPGYYNIYLTKNNYISIEKVGGGDDPVTTFMWGIAGSATNWALDEEHPFVKQDTAEEDAIYTYKLEGYVFAENDTWKVKNSDGEWIANQTDVGFDLSKSTAGAFVLSDGNIKVLTGGTYDITLNIWEGASKDGNDFVTGVQIYAVKQAEPAKPSIVFNTESPQVTAGSSLTIPVTATLCSEIEYIVIENEEYVEVDKTLSDDTQLVVNGLLEGTTTIKAVASNGTEATISVECVENSPLPEEDKDYIVKLYHNGEWSQLEMSPTPDDESQYEYTGDFTKGDIFVIHMEDDTWYHFSDVKEGCAELVKLNGTEDIELLLDGNYTIYADYDADDKGNHIWIKRNVAPAAMIIEGSDPIVMSANPDKDGEFMVKNVSLETNQYFSFEYDGQTAGFDNIKSDSPEKGTANIAKHIAVTTAGTYDIYFDTNKIGEKCIYIAPHVETVTVTFKVIKDCGIGNGVYLVGDFCNWDLTKGIRGEWTSGDVWVFTVTVEPGTTWSEFKFVINNYDEPSSSISGDKYEGGSNRSYTFNADAVVTYNWQ